MKLETNNIKEKEKEILESYDVEEYVFTEEEVKEELENTPEDEVLEIYEETTSPQEITKEEIESIPTDEEDEEEPVEKKKSKLGLIIGIIIVILLIPTIMIVTDVVAVKKYQKGPFFAINTKTYKDGGSKVYTGLGYKVIKYNQKHGRRDTVIGTWGLKYSNTVLATEAIDLAIEYTDKPGEAIKKYQGKFMSISGVLTNVSLNENTITISYIDEDGKYNFDILCDMASNKDKLKEFETSIRITAMGTVSGFDYATPDTNATLHLKDCLAEQDI